MTAKEMFEKLGYVVFTKTIEKNKDLGIHFSEIYVKKINYENNTIKDIFIFESGNNNNKIIVKEIYITPKELQAINKQIEELGWNIK